MPNEEFKEKYGVTVADFQLAAKAGYRLASLGGEDSEFLRVFLNNIVNGCKEKKLKPQDIFRRIIKELQMRSSSPQTPKEFYEKHGFYEGNLN